MYVPVCIWWFRYIVAGVVAAFCRQNVVVANVVFGHKGHASAETTNTQAFEMWFCVCNKLQFLCLVMSDQTISCAESEWIVALAGGGFTYTAVVCSQTYSTSCVDEYQMLLDRATVQKPDVVFSLICTFFNGLSVFLLIPLHKIGLADVNWS